MKKRLLATSVVALVVALVLPLFLSTAARAGTVENGNELSRRLVYSNKERGKEMEKEAVGNMFFFRYMKIMEKKAITNTVPTTYYFKTQDPGSGMYADFTVTKKESLKMVADIQEGEALAFVCKIKSINKESRKIEAASVIVRYKDKLAPAVGKELLSEVDKTARYGTDTSTGEEKVSFQK